MASKRAGGCYEGFRDYAGCDAVSAEAVSAEEAERGVQYPHTVPKGPMKGATRRCAIQDSFSCGGELLRRRRAACLRLLLH